MASLVGNISTFSKSVLIATDFTRFGFQQVRNKWADWRMIKDYKRRQIAKEYAPLRLRLLGLKRNNVLPKDIRTIADEEMLAVPRRASQRQLTNRCALTSRPRGTVYRWRLSRIVFRHYADYNLLAGIQRAMW